MCNDLYHQNYHHSKFFVNRGIVSLDEIGPRHFGHAMPYSIERLDFDVLNERYYCFECLMQLAYFFEHYYHILTSCFRIDFSYKFPMIGFGASFDLLLLRILLSSQFLIYDIYLQIIRIIKMNLMMWKPTIFLYKSNNKVSK